MVFLLLVLTTKVLYYDTLSFGLGNYVKIKGKIFFEVTAGQMQIDCFALNTSDES